MAKATKKPVKITKKTVIVKKAVKKRVAVRKKAVRDPILDDPILNRHGIIYDKKEKKWIDLLDEIESYSKPVPYPVRDPVLMSKPASSEYANATPVREITKHTVMASSDPYKNYPGLLKLKKFDPREFAMGVRQGPMVPDDFFVAVDNRWSAKIGRFFGRVKKWCLARIDRFIP